MRQLPPYCRNLAKPYQLNKRFQHFRDEREGGVPSCEGGAGRRGQVAAFADNQLLIQKNVRADRTYTEIHTLDLDGRVQVLARMISGDKVTDLSLANARELIEKSR